MNTNPVEETRAEPPQQTERNTTRLISELQSRRNSKIITYVVSTRQGLNFQIADDAIRIIYEHLIASDIAKGEKIVCFYIVLGE